MDTATTIQQTIYGDNNIVTGTGDVYVLKIVNPLPLRPNEADTRRELQILLGRVRTFWIESVLEKSLHNTLQLDLGLANRSEAISHPWESVLQLPDSPGEVLPSSKKIGEVFDQANRLLLILGEPGSGKTITLLELARELITRADQSEDFTQPVPVVLNLSTWVNQSLPLLDWMAAELAAKYAIPRRIARSWLLDHRLLPLLDGLDEVRTELQPACVQAINSFIQTVGAPGLVVCSRTEEYSRLPVKLGVQGAVLIMPLSPAQVDSYLATAGESLAALRLLLQKDTALQSMAQTPLMLSVMSLAYRDMPAHALEEQATGSLEERRQRLFDTYIQRMFERKGRGPQPFSPSNTRSWLSWLARQMEHHGQSIFLIEQLQPSWIESHSRRWLYALTSRMTTTLAYYFTLPPLGILLGLFQGLVDGLRFERQNRDDPKAEPARWGKIGYVALIAFAHIGITIATNLILMLLVIGFVAAQSSVSLGTLWNELISYSIAISIGYGVYPVIPGFLLGIRGSRQTINGDIRTVEALRWSWREAIKGALKIGGAAALLGGLLTALTIPFLAGSPTLMEGSAPSSIGEIAIFAIIFGVIGAVSWFFYAALLATPFAGLTSGVVAGKTQPNQGMRLSLRNAFRAALSIGSWFAIAFSLLYSLATLVASLFFVITGESDIVTALASWVGVSIFMIVIITIIGLPSFGLVAALWFGGFDLIQHYILRFYLIRAGNMPSKYADFLDYAAERIFLRKVGGGYIFVHRYLQEHFSRL